MHDESHRSRFDHQREVERLLEQIRRGVREVRRLQAAGVRAPALGDRKRELKEARARLAAVIGGQVPHAVDRAA